MKRVIWFRRDLRLQDNKALAHALQNSAADELILLFQMNPQQFIQESANHNAFCSLASFKERIDQEAHLQIMVGEPLDLFSRLKRKLPDWQAIYFNEDTCGFGAKRDQQAMRFLKKNNIQSFSFKMPICMALKKLRRTMAASTKCLRPITINGKRRLKKHRFLFPIQLKKFLVRVFFQKRKQLIVNRLRGFL